MKRKILCHILVLSVFNLCSCADLWHEMRYRNGEVPHDAAIPIEKESKHVLTKEEKANLLTQKLIMAISMKGLEGIHLKCADSSWESVKVFAALYQERIVEHGNDYLLSVHINEDSGEACISETASGKVILRTVLPTE